MSTKQKSPTRTQLRRHGHHQKRTRHFAKVYLPYLPLLPLLATAAIGLLLGSPTRSLTGTLAYATEMSQSGLLASTNSQRAANGQGNVSLNAQLNAAAQAKANDMVTRNYWSHNTPDGQPPWVFIQNAGYTYTKAGENLAYGFDTSANTVTGWMNSPAHKTNMLDGAYTEVGFGFANSGDFNNSGQETVVVAMYGQPQVLAAMASPAPPAAPAAPPKTVGTASPAPVAPAPAPESTPVPEPVVQPVSQPVTSRTPIIAEPAHQSISRGQTLASGRISWIVPTMAGLSSLAVLVLLVRHSLRFRHILLSSEMFVLRHPLIDTSLASIALLGYFLTQTTGFIR